MCSSWVSYYSSHCKEHESRHRVIESERANTLLYNIYPSCPQLLVWHTCGAVSIFLYAAHMQNQCVLCAAQNKALYVHVYKFLY